MRRLFLFAVSMSLIVWLSNSLLGSPQDTFPVERTSEWHGFQQSHFKVESRSAYVVAPKAIADGNPWVWRARFPNYHFEMDVALLKAGFHIGYVDVGGMFGNPKSIEIGDKFYQLVTQELGLASKPALEGVSRGGLFVYNWAVQNPDKVSCIYCDTPVCDIRSWPGGKGSGNGSGNGAATEWKKCLEMYGLTENQAAEFDRGPLDQAETIAKAKLPILHIVSENDQIVPPTENTYVLKKRIELAGHSMEIISVSIGTDQSSGHHFTHPDPERVVEFIQRHAMVGSTERMEILGNAKRILFLGDSITYAGRYVSEFETWLELQELENTPVVINAGLPSETISGLSEPNHAGGRFPRPDLAERLQRVLDLTKPDLVFACYGINCGIYQPFDKERLAKYQFGILALKKQVEAVGAQLILITPPFYDDLIAKKPFSYNEVMSHYSEWLVDQEKNGWLVIDLHDAMTKTVAERRKSDPKFTFQPDAVHPNAAGHWFIATRLIRWFGDESAASMAEPEEMIADTPISNEKFALIHRRMLLRRDAYLFEAGHKRPGIKKGLPVNEATEKAKALSEKIRSRRSD